MTNTPLQVDPSRCTRCGRCIPICPVQALSLATDGLCIDDERCTACSLCVATCPTHALELARVATSPNTVTQIWVWVDPYHTQASWELLGQARRLSDQVQARITACITGHALTDLAQHAIGYGADRVWCADDERLHPFRLEPHSALLVRLVQQKSPDILLLPATQRGRDLASTVASALHTGLTADCTALMLDVDSGLLHQTRPAYGGNLIATILCPNHRPQMATVRPHVFAVPNMDREKSGEILSVPTAWLTETSMTTVLHSTQSQSTAAVAEAQVIVAGGRGMGGPEGFNMLRELAERIASQLGVTSAVGASRAAVDAGWISYEHQIGQTGYTVRPRLYIACGISGSMQHLVGMRTSRVILAINSHRQAPILNIADYGIVGDARQIVQAILDQAP